MNALRIIAILAAVCSAKPAIADTHCDHFTSPISSLDPNGRTPNPFISFKQFIAPDNPLPVSFPASHNKLHSPSELPPILFPVPKFSNDILPPLDPFPFFLGSDFVKFPEPDASPSPAGVSKPTQSPSGIPDVSSSNTSKPALPSSGIAQQPLPSEN